MSDIIIADEIVLDWSGTVSDDFYAIFTSSNDVFEKYGIRRLSEKEYRQIFDLPIIDFYRKFFIEPDMEAFNSYFRERVTENLKIYPLKPIAGVEKHLEAITAKGIPCSVISAHYAVVEEAEEYFPGKNYFSRIIVLAKDKAKALSDFACERKTNPERILYVGDMKGDIRAAHAAGVIPIAVLTGYHDEEQLRSEKPHKILKDLGELVEIVRRE